MGRLTHVKARIKEAAPRLHRSRDAEGHSRTAERWRAWYHLAKWKHPTRGLRMQVLVRDLFTCQMEDCGRLCSDTSQLVADHKKPHRGDPVLFWDETNLWTLCLHCHNSIKQAEERGAA